MHRQIYAAWFQDDWKVGSKLTLNMGVRYDLDHGAQGEFVKFLPWLSGKRPTDKNNARAAARLRVPGERQVGHPRRLGPVLHASSKTTRCTSRTC